MVMCLKMPSTTSAPTMMETTEDNAAAGPSNSSNRSSLEDKDPPVSVDDTEEASDEVKVYENEEEDEDEPKTNSQQSSGVVLSDDKSGLINESEQSKDTRQHDHAFAASRLLDPFLGTFYQNLLHHSASYALSMGRPSFWENVVTGGPASAAAAAAAATHSGLRPPLYHLPPPPPHGQYPYSMLGPDQLAAWHQQAAVYHQAGALRAGSPYSSLPITSATSRFPPGAAGLLGHHGLSPSGAQGHLPHIKADLDAANSGNHHHGSSHHHGGGRAEKESKKKENHIKKPLNAFMLYMKEMRPVVQAECTLKESAAINQILGRRWHDLSREEQAKYYEKARSERQKHMEMYPHWNARDNYRFGLKKKKRKRDKADDPAASLKKCRARFGLDQQDQWCRPCRRKKKCIRVQHYLPSEGKSSASGNNQQAMMANGQAGQAAQYGGQLPGSSGNPMGHHHKNNNHNSDGEDDDEDDDEDHSPDSRSLGSTSEQSLTSPAGFSSLNSLGSPASIASPSTPSGFEAAVSQADLFRPSIAGLYGAFKPPPASAASTATSNAPAYQPPAHLHPMFHHRPPVGTDPRDSKNPLSISQLTGNFPPPLVHHHQLHHPPVGPGGGPPDKRALPLMT